MDRPAPAARARRRGRVGTLAFDFPSGAMGTEDCRRLQEAFIRARGRPTAVICLTGGRDFWSNGIHLGLIEAAVSPAEESWRNINAINDLVREIVTPTSHLTVSALRANCAAGGCFLAIACDYVAAKEGVILNPHYKNMGNLFSSEYWTYLLPRRVGEDAAALTQGGGTPTQGAAAGVMARRLPMGAREARSLRLVDEAWPAPDFDGRLDEFARSLAESSASLLRDKAARRARDESSKPLEDYRREELERMRLNFYGFDPSYHVARYHFIHKTPKSWTPLYLAGHRR